MAKIMDSEIRHHYDLLLGSREPVTPCLSFLICNVGMIVVPIS